MIIKQHKDKDGFFREVIFLCNNELIEFTQVTDSKQYEGVYTIGDGIFEKDNKFYVRYTNYGGSVSSYFMNKLYNEHEVDLLDYHTVMLQQFPIVVRKKTFI
jgi:hypothetical protein